MAAKKTQTKKKTKDTNGLGWVTTLLATLEAKLDGLELTTLTPEDRRHSPGRLRQGEPKAMTAVLDGMDLRPGLFASLAARDHGVDDAKVETAPAREALKQVEMLAPLVAIAESLVTRLRDEALHQAELAKDVTIPGYAIVKVNLDDVKLKQKAAPATTFYMRSRGRGTKAKPKKPTP